MLLSTATPRVRVRPHACARRVQRTRCSAEAGADAVATSQRRHLLLNVAFLSTAGSSPAWAAITDDVGYEDLSRVRLKGDCALDEAGRDCRLKALKDNLSYEEQLRVGTKDGGNRGTVTANGAATSRADVTYFSKTTALVAEVERVLALDVYDTSRAAAITALTLDGKNWAGSFAPGGSSKRASGRAFYNALNQLQGHFAFNGLAPLPKSTLEKVLRNVAETKTELAAGR